MPAINYQRARATADRLITNAGQAGKLLTPGAKTGPKRNPTIGAPGEIAATFAVFDIAQREIDGTRIKQGDKRVYLKAPGETVVTTDMRLEIGGVPHEIVTVMPLAHAGLVVFVELQVRR